MRYQVSRQIYTFNTWFVLVLNSATHVGKQLKTSPLLYIRMGGDKKLHLLVSVIQTWRATNTHSSASFLLMSALTRHLLDYFYDIIRCILAIRKVAKNSFDVLHVYWMQGILVPSALAQILETTEKWIQLLILSSMHSVSQCRSLNVSIEELGMEFNSNQNAFQCSWRCRENCDSFGAVVFFRFARHMELASGQ